MNVHSFPPKILVARHNQLLRFSSNGQPLERSQVPHFAERLVDFGLDVRLDQWHASPGSRLPQFMEQEVASADIIVTVCTPQFASKANARAGGAGYEQQIVTGQLVRGKLVGRIIPVLRSGNLDNAIPTYLEGTFAIDLRDDTQLADAAEEVARAALNRPRYAPPTPTIVPDLLTQTRTLLPDTPSQHATGLTWTDPATGLMWAHKDCGSDVSWKQAMDYARSLRLVGCSDWRLPTIDELESIYDINARYRVKGKLEMSLLSYWSSSLRNASGEAWYFSFSLGRRTSILFNDGFTATGNGARCVRRS